MIYYFRCAANKKRVCPKCNGCRLKSLLIEDLKEYTDDIKLEKITKLKDKLNEKIISLEEYEESIDNLSKELESIYSDCEEDAGYGKLFPPILLLIIVIIMFIILLYTGYFSNY